MPFFLSYKTSLLKFSQKGITNLLKMNIIMYQFIYAKNLL